MVIQQHSRKLLMMDILMSETFWAHKKWNKIANYIKLVFHSSTVYVTCPSTLLQSISLKTPATSDTAPQKKHDSKLLIIITKQILISLFTNLGSESLCEHLATEHHPYPSHPITFQMNVNFFFRTNYLSKIFPLSCIPPFLLHALPTISLFLPYILNNHFN